MNSTSPRQVFLATKNLVVSQNNHSLRGIGSRRGGAQRRIDQPRQIQRSGQQQSGRQQDKVRRKQPTYVLHISDQAKEAARLAEKAKKGDKSAKVIDLKPLRVRQEHAKKKAEQKRQRRRELTSTARGKFGPERAKAYPPKLKAEVVKGKSNAEADVIHPTFDQPRGTNGSVEKSNEPKERGEFLKENFEKVMGEAVGMDTDKTEKQKVIDALNQIVETL